MSSPENLWERLKHHKVLEWTLAYAAAAYTFMHVMQMVAESFDWPRLVMRIVTLLVALGAPIVVTLAWYHGARALKRITGAELIIISILVVIAGGVLWMFGRGSDEHARSRASDSTAAAGSSSTAGLHVLRSSIAVMPFVNLTGDPAKDYLGDGLAEEVINTLTKVPGLQVPARTSSFAYKGRETDIRQIARDLNVGTVLEGSVRSAGKRIRVTAQLIDAQSGLHIWSRTYDRVFTDLFALQDELATAIVAATQVNLRGAAPASVIGPPPTRDVEAYNLYLQGFSLMLQGSEENLRRSLDFYQQALARDPRFARAFAARSRARLSFLVRGYPLDNARDDAARDAEQALILDPTLGVAHQALANVSALRADWTQAETSYRTAIADDNANPDVHSGYAMVVLAPTGRLHQAYGEGKNAYLLAPASPGHIGILATLSSYLGLDADAVRLDRLATALRDRAPSPAERIAAMRRGHYTEAADRVVASLPPTIRDAGGADVIRLVYSALGDPARKPAAIQALKQLVAKLGPGRIGSNSRRDLIVDFAMLGALDPAYELATRYLDDFLRSGVGGGADWAFIWQPEMRSFRRDARFQAFVTRMNLIDYWRRSGPPDDCALDGVTLVCR